MRPLVGTRVTPNQVTTARLGVGIAAAVAVAVDRAPWPDVGAGLFVVSMILDRADGELARLSGKTTPGGHTYDLVADAISNALIFIALGIGLRDGFLASWAVPLGFLASGAVAAVFWLAMRIEAERGARAAELKSFAGFDLDDALIVVPIAIWLNWSGYLLIAAAVGAPVFTVLFFLGRRHQVFSPKNGRIAASREIDLH